MCSSDLEKLRRLLDSFGIQSRVFYTNFETDIDLSLIHILPGLTDFDEHLVKLGEFVKTLKNVDKFEILPYHTTVSYTHLDVYKRQAPVLRSSTYDNLWMLLAIILLTATMFGIRRCV